MENYRYKGYEIRKVNHPTAIKPDRMTWDIYDGEKCKKSNIGSLDVARHYIDVMIKYGYFMEGVR